MIRQTRTVEVTAFGSTREVEVQAWTEDPQRYDSVGRVALGQFPTGTKMHKSTLTLWKREQSTGRTLRGETAAIIDGDEYIADTTLYIHNSNRGRLTTWNDEAFVEKYGESIIGRWN